MLRLGLGASPEDCAKDRCADESVASPHLEIVLLLWLLQSGVAIIVRMLQISG
jgi:hypothetical protein